MKGFIKQDTFYKEDKMANKIKYGLRSVYYAKITEGEGGAITYETPVAIPGAVNLSLSGVGDTNDFYADDTIYYSTNETIDKMITLYKDYISGETLADELIVSKDISELYDLNDLQIEIKVEKI